MKLISFTQIVEITGLSRSTIERRAKHLKLTIHYNKMSTKTGRSPRGLSYEDYQKIASITKLDKRVDYTDITNKNYLNQFAHREKQNDNRDFGLYHTVSPRYLINCFQGGSV